MHSSVDFDFYFGDSRDLALQVWKLALTSEYILPVGFEMEEQARWSRQYRNDSKKAMTQRLKMVDYIFFATGLISRIAGRSLNKEQEASRNNPTDLF